MVEDNAAIIAACLPTMYHLVSSGALKKLFGSVREVISLRSLLSTRRSNTEHKRTMTTTINDKGLNGTQDEKRHLTRLQGESSVQSNVDHASDDTRVMEEGVIAVRRDFLQDESFR
jgi:hypothetical protein